MIEDEVVTLNAESKNARVVESQSAIPGTSFDLGLGDSWVQFNRGFCGDLEFRTGKDPMLVTYNFK